MKTLWFLVIVIMAFSGTSFVFATNAIPRNGLVGEWTFENNVLDTSGTGNNGILSGGTTFVTGISGNALNFNGTSGVVAVPNNPTLNFGNGSFSVSTWMKTNSSVNGWLVDHASNNDGVHAGYLIGSGPAGIRARIEENSTNTAFVDGTTRVNDGLFHHVVLVVDRSTQAMKLYIDDNLQGSTNIANVGNTTTYIDLRMGGVTPPDTSVGFFNGTIDQTRIYNRVLSTSEISDLFNEGHTPPPVPEFPLGGMVFLVIASMSIYLSIRYKVIRKP